MFSDIALESVRALLLALLVGKLLIVGRQARLAEIRGWVSIIGGFSLLLFGCLIDITDNFDSLNRFVVIGDTEVQAALEKLVGYLGGTALLALGFWYWMPKVLALRQAEEALRRANESLEQQVHNRTAELHRANHELQHQAATDFLTGIVNRRAFMARGHELLRHRRPQSDTALLVLDLDHFKSVNDTHGHAIGDRALQAFARHCAGQLRADDLLARLGGEEFAVLLPEVDLATAIEVAERIRLSLRQLSILAGEGQVQLSVSIGLAMAGKTKDLDVLLREADQALYRAKAAGRDRVQASAAGR